MLLQTNPSLLSQNSGQWSSGYFAHCQIPTGKLHQAYHLQLWMEQGICIREVQGQIHKVGKLATWVKQIICWRTIPPQFPPPQGRGTTRWPVWEAAWKEVWYLVLLAKQCLFDYPRLLLCLHHWASPWDYHYPFISCKSSLPGCADPELVSLGAFIPRMESDNINAVIYNMRGICTPC